MNYSDYISMAHKAEQKAMKLFSRADFYHSSNTYSDWLWADDLEVWAAFYAHEATRYYAEASIAKS